MMRQAQEALRQMSPAQREQVCCAQSPLQASMQKAKLRQPSPIAHARPTRSACRAPCAPLSLLYLPRLMIPSHPAASLCPPSFACELNSLVLESSGGLPMCTASLAFNRVLPGLPMLRAHTRTPLEGCQ